MPDMMAFKTVNIKILISMCLVWSPNLVNRPRDKRKLRLEHEITAQAWASLGLFGLFYSWNEFVGTSAPVADSIKLILFANKEFFCFFAAKLGHFIINYFFLCVASTQS